MDRSHHKNVGKQQRKASRPPENPSLRLRVVSLAGTLLEFQAGNKCDNYWTLLQSTELTFTSFPSGVFNIVNKKNPADRKLENPDLFCVPRLGRRRQANRRNLQITKRD